MEPAHFESLYPDTSRFEEIEKILKFAREGKSSQLIGLPGVGRSNTLGLLSYNKNIRKKHLGENKKWFHFVLCNFSEIRKKSLYDATKFIFLNMVESLRQRGMYPEAESRFAGVDSFDTVNKIFKESLEINDELVLFQGLKRAIDFLCIEKELTIVFLFDRFEEYIPELDTQFFANLRILRNRAKYRFSVVFSLNRPLEELLEPMLFADFYEFVADNVIFLSLLDKPGLDFRISYLEKVTGKKIDKKTLEEVVNLTGGHGKLTRLSLETSLKNNPDNKPLSEFLLDQKSIKGSLFETWKSLTPSEQSLILKKNFDEKYLIDVGLIKDGRISIPLLDEFIPTIKQSSNEIISFDPNTNDIKRGDTGISDILTSSEFKLLKFLLENTDRIIDREEIIRSVWRDEKTTEGVTDQALDQLIFRLRKKIEEDPNNPVHIQTFKGKGIKFINV